MKEEILAKLMRKIAELPLEMLGTLYDLVEELSSETGQNWLVELRKFLGKEKYQTEIAEEIYLKLISADHSLILDACDGLEFIAGTRDMFEAGIDPDFLDLAEEEPGAPTPETFVEVHEEIRDGTFRQIFNSISIDTEKLCFTESQIKGFVRKYRQWLREKGCATFFLFKSQGHFFIAYMHINSDGKIYAHKVKFDHINIWESEFRNRIVVPKLERKA